MEQWVSWIPEVGFPILVTFYLLHRIESRLEELNESILTIPKHMNM
ncbi:YvrJ family protein [Halalkalibacillus sediminis]|uniref:YvrJ family protein n=1 Tax=Halalkalibacillus sediminis TaxID=2018042 RepID=A0A2I0QVV0_9BACI|nr:YvrJ family protein [Halalkalibacillus sediminis]PKR78456.1 YvrJ family protein [Halalkalibacillus sediminis]